MPTIYSEGYSAIWEMWAKWNHSVSPRTERKLLDAFLVVPRRNPRTLLAGSYELHGIGDSDSVHW